MRSSPYCSVAEVLSDLTGEGVRIPAEGYVLDKILAASQWIERRIGSFTPFHGQRYADGLGWRDLIVEPVLSVDSVTIDGVAYPGASVVLQPLNMLWAHGPAIRLQLPADSLIGLFPRGVANIAISGVWGLYDDREALEATVANQGAAETVLTVNQASEISPGMVLLIGDEQQIVTGTGTPADSQAKLAAATDADTEELELDQADKLHPGEIIRIGFEQMLVEDVLGPRLAVRRGWRQTKRVEHASGVVVEVYRSFGVTRGANGTQAAAHAGSPIRQQVAPDDIRWLCRQMAGLMIKKAQSHFAGRVGNAETGETFYLNEFPSGVIEKIEANYYLPYL